MFIYLNKKAQSTAEYVIVLGLIVGAVIAMQTYIKRGLQGRIKDAVDFTDQGGQNSGVVQFSGKQYEPYYLSSSFSTDKSSADNEAMSNGGGVERTSDESSDRRGRQIFDLGRASNE